MFFLLKIKGFDFNKISACTLVFEGTREEVDRQKKIIYNLAPDHGGLVSGSENGEKGYILTFAIAYIRDFGTNFSYIAESMETSCPWSKVNTLQSKVRARMIASCDSRGIKGKALFLSFRVTQIYETGAAVYIYFAFNYATNNIPREKAVEIYEEIENEARDEVMKQGGSLSHHHGIGKLRKRYMNRVLAPTSIIYLHEMK